MYSARWANAMHPRWNEGLRFRLRQPGLAGDAGRGPVAAFTAGVLLFAVGPLQRHSTQPTANKPFVL